MSKEVKLVAHPGRLIESVRHDLNTLDAACFPEDPLYPKDDCYWWIVRGAVSEQPLAFAGLKPLSGPNNGMGFLCRAGVVASSRGLGWQRRLIEVRLRYAKRLKLREVITYTARDNYRSAANLLRMGFHFYTPLEEWGMANALYFRKGLS